MTTKTPLEAPARNVRCDGLVHLGELSAIGAWKDDGEILSLHFSTDSLGRDQLRLVRDLKLNSRPVSLALQGKRAADYHIVGFEEKPGRVTFHVSREKR